MKQNQHANLKRSNKHKNSGRRSSGSHIPQKNKAYDSTGPYNTKVRGTSQQVYDRYTALAKEAHISGERVDGEAYYQHAEHYFREMQRVNALHAEAAQQQAEENAKKQAEMQKQQAEAKQAKEAAATKEAETTEDKVVEKVEKEVKPRKRPVRKEQAAPAKSDTITETETPSGDTK